jgi:repressor LexA
MHKVIEMNEKPLTKRQKEILTFIADHIDSAGFPPTRNDISKHFGFRSPNAAESHLRALEHKGVIRIQAGQSRGITMTALSLSNLPPSNTARMPLPLIGRVAAGSPILAQENIEHEYRVDPSLFTSRPHYLLRVEGNSMRDAGILDGDLLAVHRTPEARNGQIVVARLDDEVTVKRFKRRGHMVSLLPDNTEFQPIQIDLRHQELVIEGLGVGIVRPHLEG